MTLRRQQVMSVAVAVALCVLARPAAAEPQQSPVLDGLRALGLPAPDLHTPRSVTIDLNSVGLPSFDLPGLDVTDLLDNAMSFIGVPYRFGGSSPATGFDCSGFVKYVFNKTFSLTLPRTAREMARTGMSVARGELQPGDLVFFNTRGSVNSHVGIYIGDSKFVHAPNHRSRVRVNDLGETYYSQRFNGARRIANVEGASQPAKPPFKGAVGAFGTAPAQGSAPAAALAPAAAAPVPAPAPSTLIRAASGG